MTAPAAPARERWSIQRVAQELDVHHLTVRRMISDGRLPAHRIGRKLIRIWSDDVAALGESVGGVA